MKVRRNVLISIILFFAMGLAQLVTPTVAFADSTVGSGSPASCTAAALASAVASGGDIDFDCGGSPHTITVSAPLEITGTTAIDGGGLITISGGDAQRVFTVNTGVTFSLENITVSDGYKVGHGGGMFIDSAATVTITRSTFKDNNVLDGYGGAIYVNDATLNVSDSSFITNNADVSSLPEPTLGGGAIQNNDGAVEILGSTFNGNTVTSPSADGGAIYNGDLDGIGNVPDANADVMEIGNSTFYNNSLVGDTGTSGSSGGAIRSNGDITLAHNTFSDNDSGVTMGAGEESGAVTFGHGTALVVYNIFANSSGFSATDYDCAKRSGVTLTPVGNLVESDFTCGGAFATDPNLGALQNNGGPTLTMAPGAPSAAINGGTACVTDLVVDQRGVSRPQPGGTTDCDLGAVEVDTDAPTVTVAKAGGQADPTNVSPVNYTVTFSEPVVNFTPDDLNLSASTVGGTPIGAITSTLDPEVYNVAVTGMTTPGNITLSIDEDALTDIALNGNDASTSADPTVAYDATGATVTLEQAAGQDDPTNNTTINFTVVFDESVSDFNAADVTLGGTAGASTKNVTGSGTTYNLAVGGMTGDGTVTATVNAGAVSDSLGNPSSASTSSDNLVNYDGTAPTVSSITRQDTNPTNAASVQFLVTFSEDVSGTGATSNFSLAAGSPSGAAIDSVTGTGSTRTVTVDTGTGNGTIQLNMANSTGMADAAGNAIGGLPYTAGDSYTVDKTQPTVSSINRVSGSPTNAASVDFVVTFNESVSGGGTSNFALTSDVSGALISGVSGTGATRTVTVNTGTGNGTIRLDLDNSTGLADAAGNPVSNVPFTTGQVYAIDRTAPTVTVEQAVGQADPTNDSPIAFTVTFSENVTGFTNSDITLSSGTAAVAGGPAMYSVTVTGMSEGTLTASIPANAVIDTAGNNNTASTSSDNAVLYDTTSPTVTINKKAGQNDPAGAEPIEFTVVFSESVADFTNSDVTLSGSANPSTASVTGSGTTYTVAVTGMTQSGTVVASLAAGVASDDAGNTNLEGTSTDNQVEYDPENPTVTITVAGGQANPTGFSPAHFTVVFSEPVTGFATGDVDIDGTSGATTATVTEIAPNDDTTYNVAVSGMTSSGTAILSIPAGVAQDSALLPNLPSLSATITFTFVRPGVPALTAPAAGSIVSGLQPLLNWNDSNPGAQYYELQVATVKTFASTVINETDIAVSEYTPDFNLTPGVRYYWRVRALNAIDQASAWSAIRDFRTPLQTPVLSSPIGGAVLTTDRITFEWDDVPGATVYTLQISTAGNFKSGLVTKTSPTSTYTMPTDLAQNKVFFWRVMAKAPVVSSGWAGGQSFRTGNPPTVPVLATPKKNALVTILNPLFNWSNAALPLPANSTTFEHYQIQVDDNADFNSPTIDKQTPTGSITSSQYQSQLADGLVVNQKYYWRVRAVNDFGGIDQFSAWSPVFTFRSAIVAPVLLSPDDTTTPSLTTRRPVFEWEDSDGATGYSIQISQNANMTSPLLSVNVSASPYLATKDLPANKTLFWRVRAIGPNGPSLWSEIWTFKTGNPPSVPALSSPANNALTTNYFPVFDWTTSTLPAGTFKHYELQVDDDGDFSSLTIQELITDRADSRYLTQPDPLDSNTTYYWRVRAVSTIDPGTGPVDHTSGWSAVRTVRTALVAPTPVAPIGTIAAQPVFEWVAVSGATGYTIQVSTSSNFGTLLLNINISNPLATTYDPTKVLPLNKTLFWRIRANGTNPSAWSGDDFIIDTTP